MILYFSGTGNSLYIAKEIAKKTKDRILSISEMVIHDTFTLVLEKDEKIGFVYPVIACAPPDIVTDFVKKMKLQGYDNNYIYSIFNCAGSPEYTSRVMKEACEKAGYPAKGFYDILMPGNYITRKKHLPEEKVKKYLNECDGKIAEIADQVMAQKENYKKEKHSFFQSYVLHKLAVLEKTENFVFGEQCVQCMKCSNICPMEAIQLVDGKMTRDAKKCAFCLGCVNVCPTHALQVGKKTQGHPQYINASYNGKARGQAADYRGK